MSDRQNSNDRNGFSLTVSSGRVTATDRLRAGDVAGFTLVEMLTVVVLVGILAAIALVTFSGESSKASNASTKSDVRNLAVVEESYLAASATTYGSATQLATQQPLAASKGDTVWVYTNGSVGYCLVGGSSGSSNFVVYNSTAGGLSSTVYKTQSSAATVCTAAGYSAAGKVANTSGQTTAT